MGWSRLLEMGYKEGRVGTSLGISDSNNIPSIDKQTDWKREKDPSNDTIIDKYIPKTNSDLFTNTMSTSNSSANLAVPDAKTASGYDSAMSGDYSSDSGLPAANEKAIAEPEEEIRSITGFKVS